MSVLAVIVEATNVFYTIKPKTKDTLARRKSFARVSLFGQEAYP